nr:immunoglobulin heavy chain junction region [Mus musculus]
CARDDAMDYW